MSIPPVNYMSDILRKSCGTRPVTTISFHRLNGLTPTFSSCRDKVYEEIGEVMQLLGKGQRASGERVYPAALGPEQDSYADWVYRVFEEILDSAQSLVTMAFVLADENNIDVPGEIGRHEAKLVAKGYLVESNVESEVQR